MTKKSVELYEEGLNEIDSSIALSGVNEEHKKEMLIAYGNLKFGKKELEDLKNANGDGFKALDR